jgi:hypothetical protein
MTKPESKTTEQAKKPAAEGELTDAALNQASGGALNAYTPAPTEAAHGSGGGGGAGKPAACDGSVKTNSALIGLL